MGGDAKEKNRIDTKATMSQMTVFFFVFIFLPNVKAARPDTGGAVTNAD